MKLNELNPEEKRVILQKGTEAPFTGKFEAYHKDGIYTCRQCNAFLYRSSDKFDSGCGWPSFDDEIAGAVEKHLDADGSRTEIVCNRCNAHLGHVFSGEQLTQKNIRHCVNSVSMDFLEVGKNITDSNVSLVFEKEKTIYLGGGCFWCVEAVFKMIKGVSSVVSGYAGGQTENPKYDDVCGGQTGHAEIVKVVFDPTVVAVEKILEVFFDAHDPTTLNRQGNDVGTQYRSVVFLENKDEVEIVQNFIKKVQADFSQPIVTEISVLSEAGNGKFYSAEDYHQDYFNKNGHAPYCQIVVAPKIEKIKKKYL
jgi:peptide methionine sulfoxide reductase msrA/msrB